MQFHENLIRYRKQKGLSQEELGNYLNVARQTVSKWENNETTPEMDKLIQLSQLFDVSIDELVGNKAKPSMPQGCITRMRLCFAYEYKSRIRIKGIPLLHVHIGRGFCQAKGIIAIGNVAKGVIALGGISLGLIALGGVNLGLLALGGFSLGLLFAIGGLAIGSIAVGGLAFGFLAIGGLAIGIYAMGGAAFGTHIACGEYASAPIAIGERARGTLIFLIEHGVPSFSADEIRTAILQKFPHTWPVIVDLFSSFY